MTDPLREPPVRGFHAVAPDRWQGRPAAVVELAYCNLRCPWCDARALVLAPGRLPAWSISQVKEGLFASPADTVVVTGGEPSMHRALPLLLLALKETGKQIILETNGTQPDMLRLLGARGLASHVVLSLKAPLDEESWERAAGVYVPVEIIRESLAALKESGLPFTLSCTVAPGILSKEDVLRLAREVREFGPLTLTGHRTDGVLDPDAAGLEAIGERELANLRKDVAAIFAGVDNYTE
jgi:pyruvate formate lyase activating enzyme